MSVRALKWAVRNAVEVAEGDVLAAPPASADAALSPHHLRHQAVEVARVGEEVAVVAVVGQDRVIWMSQGAYHRHLAELLTEASMRGAGE